jgi:hypothetical protein
MSPFSYPPTQPNHPAAARSVGLLCREADRSYLPSPLPDLLGRVLAIHNVKVLVFGWREAVIEPWVAVGV